VKTIWKSAKDELLEEALPFTWSSELSPYGYEFRAMGYGMFRLTKELSDGRRVHLEGAFRAVTGENFRNGLVLRRKLEAAVIAARWWKKQCLIAENYGAEMVWKRSDEL
jgi:hypothetical protein